MYPARRKAGVTILTEDTIDVQGATPFKHHPRRMSPKIQKVAIEKVERMYHEGVIAVLRAGDNPEIQRHVSVLRGL